MTFVHQHLHVADLVPSKPLCIACSILVTRDEGPLEAVVEGYCLLPSGRFDAASIFIGRTVRVCAVVFDYILPFIKNEWKNPQQRVVIVYCCGRDENYLGCHVRLVLLPLANSVPS